MNLILIGPADLLPPPPDSSSSDDDVVIDLPPDDDRARHVLGHLGKADGETVSVGFVDPAGGRRCKAVVFRRRDGGVRLVCKQRETRNDAVVPYIPPPPPAPPPPPPPPPLPEITLLLAFPFPSRLRYLWPVISSFAMVTRIVVVGSRLSNSEYAKSSASHPTVYGPAIVAGMSQGGNTRPVKVEVFPMVGESISREWMERRGLARRGGARRRGREGGVGDVGGDDDEADCDGKKADEDDDDDGTARIFLDCGDEGGAVPPPARDVVLERCLGRRRRTPPSAVLAVGPERGWTDDEAGVFVGGCGFRSATLGGSILRVDAAVVAGLGMVSAALDECVRSREDDDDDDVDARRKGTKRDTTTMMTETTGN